MRDLATLTPRQLLYLWLGGLGLVPVLIGGGLALIVRLNHSQNTGATRHLVLQAARDRKGDSSFLARHAHDSLRGEVLTAWKDPYVERRLKLMSDSLLMARVAAHPTDTAFTPYENSAAAMGWMLAGGTVFLAFYTVALGIPFALVGLTAWWWYKRQRAAT